jgi:hypothetical protein
VTTWSDSLAYELAGAAPDEKADLYRHDPLAWVLDHINFRHDEPGPSDYQGEILTNLATYRREAVRGPHGLGKTALASWAILWFANTRDGEDWKVVTTASAWRQLTKFLWPEVRKWARRLDWEKLGRPPYRTSIELKQLGLTLKTGEAFAVASDIPELIEGAHADHILYVFDESKAIVEGTFDAAEGALSTGEAYALAISTPGEPQGRFYDIHRRAPGTEDWHVRHVTLAESIAAGRIDPDWAESRRRQWGEDSAVYINRVLGEFATQEEDGVIPLRWVEVANERWQVRKEDGTLTTEPFRNVGVDLADTGEDDTVFALRYGDTIAELRRWHTGTLMEHAGRVAQILGKHPKGRAIVDVIGIGAGVVSRLKELNLKVHPFNAAVGTKRRDRTGELTFTNLRSAAWWNLRDMLDPEGGFELALPPDDRLTGDLTAPRWKVTSGGRIQVESKEDIHKRLGRSTDTGDAVVQAFWDVGDAVFAWARDEDLEGQSYWSQFAK